MDLALTASLIVAEAALSLLLGLGIHKQVTIAAARMVVQLLLVGYALRLIFALTSPALTLLAVALMAIVAVREIAVRPEQRLARAGNYTISLAGGHRHHGADRDPGAGHGHSAAALVGRRNTPFP